MKIQKVSTENINFGQNQVAAQTSSMQTQPQKDLPQISTIPSQFVNVQTPTPYTKIGEYEIFQGTKTHVYKLANGQTVLLTPSNGNAKINTVIRCGASNEPDNLRGISHYIEHNLFNGSKKFSREDVDTKTNEIGAYSNAFTSDETTAYYLSANITNEKDLQKMIELHADMLQNPTFDQKMLEKEKGIVNSEIGMHNDYDFAKAYNAAKKQLFQIQTTSDDLVLGTVDNINALTRDNVVNYYNTNYTTDKMTTIMTGDFDPEKAIELISKNFTKTMPQTKPTPLHLDLKPIDKSVRTDLYNSNTDTSKFFLMMKGPENKDLKENVCMRLLLEMFNLDYSKLNNSMKKYNSVVGCCYGKIDNQPESPSYISFEGNCADSDTENILKIIYSDLLSFRNEDISTNLEIVKKRRLKEFLRFSENGDSINDYFTDKIQNYTPEQLKQVPEIINSITVEDIRNFYNKYIDLNKVSIAVSHPKKKEENKNAVAFKGKSQNKGLDLSEFRYAKLPNNTEVYLKDDNSDLKSFSMSVKAKIPANINPMLCNVLNFMLKKGSISETEDEFNRNLDKNSSSLEIIANSSGFEVAGNAIKDDIKYTLNKAIDVLLTPKLTQEDFEKAKKQIAHDLDGTEKSATDFVGEIMFPQIKSASTVEDRKKALTDLKLSDIQGFFKYVVMNAQNKFAWNKGEVPYELQRLGNFKSNDNTEFLSYKPLEQDVVKVQVDDKQQASIVQTYKFMQGKTPEEQANIYIMSMILGGMHNSRLFADLREQQKLAYHTGLFTEKIGNTCIINLEIETTTDSPEDKSATSENVRKSLDGFKRHVEKMKNELVTKEELETAKKTYKSKLLKLTKTNSAKMNTILSNVENGDVEFSNKVMAAIDKVTPESIQQTAQKAFAGHSLVSIVASEKTLKETGFIK